MDDKHSLKQCSRAYRKRNVNDILIHAPAGSVRRDTYCENVIDFDRAMTIGIVYVGNRAGGVGNRNCQGICLKELPEADFSRVAANRHLFDHGNPFIAAWAWPHSKQSTPA
jgi:hypothetical protein